MATAKKSTQGRAQFTPGPWRVINDKTIVGADHPGQGYVADVNLHRNNDAQEVDGQANAALIAAAPALYEALKALHSVLDQRMPDGRTLNQHLSQEVFECFYGPAIAARAAIAKAEGA